DVENIQERLDGHQLQLTQRADVETVGLHRLVERLPALEDLGGGIDRAQLLGGCALALDFLLDPGPSLLQGLEISEDEFGVDRVDVVAGTDLAVDVDDIVIDESADDLADGVGFADIGQELIAQALAFGRTAHDAGDVNEVNGRIEDLLGGEDLRQPRQPSIRQRDDAHVRFD